MRPPGKLTCLSALLLSLLVLTLQPAPIAGQVAAVDERQIEVTLVPDKPSVMLGEPVSLSFVVQNNSDQDLQVVVGGDYRNALGRPESFTITVVGKDGRRVPQPAAGPAFGGLMGPQKIPARGAYTFKLFLPHWATFEEAGEYSIVTARTLRLSKATPGRWDSKERTTNVKARAAATIEIIPSDEGRMGEVIAALGATMLGTDYKDADAAAYTLSYIRDARVIPYFAEALGTKSYDLKFAALGALSGFKDEAAFEALKRGMETSWEDIENATTREVADQMAVNIRHAAAVALAKSPHPGAVPFLLSKRNDSSEAVRTTVLHALGKMKPEEALPILREMTLDRNKRVRNEARRYLDLLSAKK